MVEKKTQIIEGEQVVKDKFYFESSPLEMFHPTLQPMFQLPHVDDISNHIVPVSWSSHTWTSLSILNRL
jgi:hypothetical protein